MAASPSPGSAPGSSPGSVPVESLERDDPRSARVRRISFFMLFRLGVLVLVTLLGALAIAQDPDPGGHYSSVGWVALVSAFGLTIVFARLLPRVEDLERFAFIQTTVDIVLSAVVVQLTGGLDSSFVFLYLVAILGAALMGTRTHTWAATGACALIYATLAGLQISGAIAPEYPPGVLPAATATEYMTALMRAMAAIAAVGVLASMLSTQLWRSSEQLESLLAMNRFIVNSLGSGLVTLDREAKLVFANPQAALLLKQPSQSLVGREASELFEGIEPHLSPTAADESRFEVGLGSDRTLGCSLGPLQDGNDERIGWVLHFQDITDLRNIEADLRRKERLAAVGGLAASVAHEVRNPLAAMAGSAELIDRNALDEQDLRLLAIIQREAARLERMVSDMLSFTTPRPLEFSEADLARVLREVSEAFLADPGNQRLELLIEAPPSVLARVDRASMSQLIWNLLRNAADASAHEGRIQLRLEASREELRVIVADEGTGISEEMQAKIFEPFQSGKLEGFGFGLALVQRIVQEHGGQISVDSREGEGATFTVVLPREFNPVASSTFPIPPNA